MQHSDAKRLEEKWAGKPCKHSDIEKEYYLGTQTGDYVCSNCGRTGPKDIFVKK